MSDEHSQISVPPAFVALFVPAGRLKPSLPREEIVRRHELCEDLAQALTEPARHHLWDLGLAEEDVLERMHRGLAGGEAGVDEAEAAWVIGRLAELLGWPLPPTVSPPARSKA